MLLTDAIWILLPKKGVICYLRTTLVICVQVWKEEFADFLVGNIPYDISEEQIVDILRQSGPVKNFKLVVDNETGRARGYGFCEYYDPETAASAIRNLSNYDTGKRKLRVDYAQNEGPIRTDHGRNAGQQTASPAAPSLIPQIVGKIPPPGTPIPDVISKTLSSYQPAQLTGILMQIKEVIHTHPAYAKQLLENNPQLSFALFQILLMMKLVDSSVLSSVIASTSTVSHPGSTMGQPGLRQQTTAQQSSVPLPPPQMAISSMQPQSQISSPTPAAGQQQPQSNAHQLQQLPPHQQQQVQMHQQLMMQQQQQQMQHMQNLRQQPSQSGNIMQIPPQMQMQSHYMPMPPYHGQAQQYQQVAGQPYPVQPQSNKQFQPQQFPQQQVPQHQQTPQTTPQASQQQQHALSQQFRSQVPATGNDPQNV